MGMTYTIGSMTKKVGRIFDNLQLFSSLSIEIINLICVWYWKEYLTK